MVELWTDDGSRCLGRADVEPICGVDFCDGCGCCIACFDGCCSGDCRPVVYEDGLAEWLDAHDLTADPFRKAGL